MALQGKLQFLFSPFSSVFRSVLLVPTASHFRASMLLRLGAIFWILLALSSGSLAEIVLRKDTVFRWAEEFGERLYNQSRTYSGSDVVYQEYASRKDVSIQTLDGLDLVGEMARKMQAMLNDKAKAVERIVEEAENGFLTHPHDNVTDFTYYNAVLVNSVSEGELEDKEAVIRKQLDVTADSHFDEIQVNTTISTVQVPTNVYNLGNIVLNSIDATEGLNEVFLDNYQQDPTLTWQYFGSRTGYFRVYPGYKWPLNEQQLDLYDCRVRGWYVEGATSSKDVIILVDMSGSMTGLYVEIAKHTIRKILDTFGDNDFVNVMSFNDRTTFVQQCFNDTMVQATSDNKNLIKEALSSLDPYGIADLGNAVRDAFRLLDEFNSTNRGSGCNQAIMIISDMLTETAEVEFRELNPNQTVRVFTYQTGREVEGPTNLIKVACSNKGYYTRLATISDVEEHVTSYLHVLSRPMVNERLRKTVWSSVYWDALHYVPRGKDSRREAILGLGLTSTVSQPVFNTRNDTLDKGILEGVAGCDVPIKELKKFTPPFQLGVNGYSFAVTNNGYILYHPELRPLYDGDKVKPNYNSVDLSEVELSDTDDMDLLGNSSWEDHLENELRNAMVAQLVGNHHMTVRQMYDHMKRVSIRENAYFYTFLLDTPYSLGIAVPETYGLKRLTVPGMFDKGASSNQSSADVCEIQQAARLIFGDGTLGQTLIANWLYCKINYSSSERYEGDEHVARFLEVAARNDGRLGDNCDATMINHLIFDANVTRFMPDYWKLIFGEGEAEGVELESELEAIMATMTSMPTNETALEDEGPDIQEILAQIDEYCSPGGQGYTAVPQFNDSAQNNDTTPESPLYQTTESATVRYTTSLPPTESVPYAAFPYLDPNRDGVVLSFVGTYGGLTRLYRNPSVYSPPEDLVDHNIQNTIEEDYYRRAVDEIDQGFIYSVPFESGFDLDQLITASTAIRTMEDNGETFVAAAAGYQFLGRALRELLMNITLESDESCRDSECTPSCGNDTVECYLIDNHGFIVVSNDEEKTGTPFAAYDQNIRLFNKLLDPSRPLFRRVTVVDYQGMCVRNISYESAATSLHNTFSNLVSVFSWFTKQFIVFLSQVSLYDWLVSITHVDGQFTFERVRWEPCDMEHFFYVANKTYLPERGLHGNFQAGCEDCIKWFSVQSVPHSNLFFIMQDRDCECSWYDPVQLDPVEVEYNDTARCERQMQIKPRRRPGTCFSYDPNEDYSECGRGFLTSPSVILTLVCLSITLYWRQD